MDPVDILEERVAIPSGGESLEGILAYPEAIAPSMAVLLLSPHPHMGGRMDNNVIAHLARRFTEEGCVTLRFNYGGVGASTRTLAEDDSPYEYWARLEAEKNYRAVLPDAIAAQAFLAAILPAPMGYVGYSFGTCLATMLAGTHPPAQLAAISPPVGRAPLVGLANLTVPSTFVVGDNDFAFDAAIFENQFEEVPGPKCFDILKGCDHFFRKEEERVYEAIRPLFFKNQDGNRVP